MPRLFLAGGADLDVIDFVTDPIIARLGQRIGEVRACCVDVRMIERTKECRANE